ncbi:zinc finger CCCH domain-containing protein 44 [Phtheirospermum japonicum]|uniref:Zinc finger CCCH domain-containing protein 44 n=1 Tax=Phtheirospermum japonicum TaxID=374723 RepID=A0A830CZ93_9LAMI|nr:zinc finger CCCH domain-containing protein 44 [Phtheirospermum japonicum]
MLQTPSEQEKLLLKLPEVIAEELEREVIATASSEKAEGSDCSPKSILRVNSDVSSTDASGSVGIVAPSQVIFNDAHAPEAPGRSIDGNPNGDQATNIQQMPLVADAICDDEGSRETTQVVVSGEENKAVEKKAEQPVVIDLSDDDDVNEWADAIWHYVDPRGQTQGPFPLYLLKKWFDDNYFHPGFRVWNSSRTSHGDGVLLVDLLAQREGKQ